MMGMMVPETCWTNNKFCNIKESVASSWPSISTYQFLQYSLQAPHPVSKKRAQSCLQKLYIPQSVHWLCYGLDNLGLECQEGQESHLFYKTFGVALGPTQPSTHWVSGALPLWLQRPGSVADHIHLLEKSRISKTTPPLPQYAIHAILTETLGEHAPSYATIKNWVAQFNP